MADQTLAQGIADLRLSTTRLKRDLADARALLLAAAREIERQIRIDIPVRVDASTARAQLRRVTDQLRADLSSIVIPVAVDPVGAVAGLQAIADISEPITVPVDADTSAARGSLQQLQQELAFDPVDVPVNVSTDPIDDFGSYASATLPPQFADTGAEAGSGFGTAFTNTLSGIFRTTSLALGGFLAGSLVKGYQRLTTIEDATASLTVALGSASKAATVLDEVLGVVRGTPFNLDQFAEAASNMISFGIAAEKVPGYLTAIGEAAASKGGRANEFAQRLSLTFGQIAVQGRITNEDILSLQLTGVDALKILGNNAEVTSFEMRELISKGIIPADEAMDQLADGIINGTTGVNGATVAFDGTMKRLRETLTGAIGGFGAATARFGVSIIDPFKEALTDGFNGASAALDLFGGAIQRNLGSFADSAALRSLRDALTDLPELATKTIDALSGLGPALAPIAAITAGLGLQSLQVFLGPFGKLLPGIAGPIGALTVGITALVAATPELREKALPVIQELFSIVTEVGGGVAVVTADLIDGLIPAIGKTIDVIDGLLPLVRGIGLGAVVVLENLSSVIGGLSTILSKFPTSVLTTIVAGFAAYKALDFAQGLFDPLQADLLVLDGLSERVGDNSKLSKALSDFGLTAKSTSKIISGAMVTATGAISGFALASDDSSAQITGAIGAISSIAIGFAQGPVAGSFATAGVAVGFLAGQFIEAKREAQELERTFKSVAESIISEIGDVSVALDDQFTITEKFGQLRDSEEATKAFIDGLGEDFVKALNEVGDIGFDVFALDADLLDPAITKLKDLEDATNKAEFQAARLTQDWGLVALGDGIFAEIEDGIRGGIVTPTGLAADAAQVYLDLLERQKTLLGELDDQGVTFQTADGDLIRDVIGLLEKRGKAEKALAEQLRVELAAEQALQTAVENRIREELEGYGLREAAIERYIELARESEDQNAIDIYNLEVATGYYDGFPLSLADIETSTFDVAAASDTWADSLQGVLGDLGSVNDILGGITEQGDALASIRGIDGFLSQIVNEAELRQAERLADQIDRQYERVQTASDRLRDAARDFVFDEEIALARIAELEEVGAVRGAAALRKQLEADRQKVQDLAAAAAEEQAKLAGLQAERGALSTTPVTIADILDQQAAELGLSLGELVLAQPTPEAQQAWKVLAAGPLRGILQAVESAAADDPAAAAALLNTLVGQWEDGLEGTDIGSGILSGITKNLDETAIKLQASAYVKDFIEAANGPGGFTDEEAIAFRTRLGDFDFTEEELQTFEDQLDALDPTIIVGIEIAQESIDALQARLFEGDPLRLPFQFGFDEAGLPVGNQNKSGGGFGLKFNSDGGILEFFKAGGIRPPENHIAQIARNTVRIFAEPETGGEAYIPLAPGKRPRSERILGDVATMFGLEVSRPVSMPAGGPVSANIGDTSRIEAAVARGIAAGMATQQRSTIAERYDRAVNVEHLHVGRDPSDRRLAKRVVNDLADLALRF